MLEAGGETTLHDDQLRLIFTCCHPALSLDAQVALTLRTLGGLTTAEIAGALLVPEPTLAQRLVRRICQACRVPDTPSIPAPPPRNIAARLGLTLLTPSSLWAVSVLAT